MKTKDELNQLKKEFENLNEKLSELTDDELTQVTGGIMDSTLMECECGFKTVWQGIYVDEVFDCIQCGKHSLKGISVH